MMTQLLSHSRCQSLLLLSLSCLSLSGCDEPTDRSFKAVIDQALATEVDQALMPDRDPSPPDAQPIDEDRGRPDSTIVVDLSVDAAGSDSSLEDEGVDALLDQGEERGACRLEESPGVEPSLEPHEQSIYSKVKVGQSLRTPYLGFGLLDRDSNLDWVLLRGGLLEAGRFTDARLWRSGSADLQNDISLHDFDGDGLTEVLLRSPDGVAILDGISGVELWRSPDNPIPDQNNFFFAQQILVENLDDDPEPELYYTDAGCSANGRGYGVVYDFQSGIRQPERVSSFTGPRRAGRCSKWHSVQRDENGAAQIAIPDGDGLQLFDALTGERSLCSDLSDMDIVGRLSHIRAEGGWFVTHPEHVGFVEVVDGESAGCPGEAQHSMHRWFHSSESEFRPQGGGILALSGENEGLLISESNGDSWDAVLFSAQDGSEVARWPNKAPLGIVEFNDPYRGINREERFVLFAESPNAGLTPPFRVQLYRFDQGEMTAQWAESLSNIIPVYQEERALNRSKDWQALQLIDGAIAPALLLRRLFSAQDQESLVLVDESGPLLERRLNAGRIGGLKVACESQSCFHGDHMMLSAVGGRLLLLNHELTPLNGAGLPYPEIEVEAGTVEALWIPTPEVPRLLYGESLALLSRGLEGFLSLSTNFSGSVRRIWSTFLGQPWRGDEPERPFYFEARGEVPAMIVAVDYRDRQEVALVGVAPESGREVWREDFDSSYYRSMGPPVGDFIDGEALVIRHYIVNDPDRIELHAECPLSFQNSVDMLSLIRPQPSCRHPIRPRHLVALNARDGQCVWQTLIRPSDECNRRSNQRISLADGDQDGIPELYMTESNSVHRIDPINGQILFSHQLENLPGAGRGGGRVIATNDPMNPLIRLGGNAPPDGFNLEMNLQWRLDVPWASRGAWLSHPHAIIGGSLWFSPEPSQPLHRSSLSGELQGRWLLGQGQVVEAMSDEERAGQIIHIASAPDGERLWVSEQDGFLYGFDQEGTHQWSRRFEAPVKTPIVGDWDGDGRDEWAIPQKNGQILVLDQSGAPPVTEVWDETCAIEEISCVSALDLDERAYTAALCAAWRPVEGVDGYEARIEAPGELPITDWVEVSDQFLSLPTTALLPGVLYRVGVRSWRSFEGERWYSKPTYSDGITLLDDEVPSLDLVLESQDVDRDAALQIDLTLADNTSLAMLLISLTPEGEGAPRELFAERLEDAERSLNLTLDLQREGFSPLEPGRYLLRALVTDLMRNRAERSQIIRIR